jgi:YesN/AraC family two-component response regulator
VRRVLNGEMLKETGGEHKKTDLLNFRYWMDQIRSADGETKKIIDLMIEVRIRQLIRWISEKGGTNTGHYRTTPFRDRSIFSDLYKLIVESFTKPVGVKYFAEKLEINPNYASMIFRKKCGITIVDFITMLRIYEAQKLLITTERKVIDIALDAGFGSVSNFYIAFNRICGKTPSEYRRSLG